MDKCALSLNTVSDFESSVFMMNPADCFSYPVPSYRSDMSDRHCVKIRTHVTGTRVYGVTGVPPSCIEQAELASCSSAPVKVKCQLPPVAGLGLETFGSTCSLDTGIMQTWNHNCFHSPGNRYRYRYRYR